MNRRSVGFVRDGFLFHGYRSVSHAAPHYPRNLEETWQNDVPEINRRLKNALKDLKSSYRSLILLKYYFGLSYEEIAETMEISVTKVKDRLFNARLALRDKLNETRFFNND